MADKDVIIGISTTGGQKAASEIKKVEISTKELDQSSVKINDTTKKNTAVVTENVRALNEWQAARNAARKSAGSSDLASDPAAFFEKEEKALSGLNAEMRKTVPLTETFTAGATRIDKSSFNASRSLLLFSQGFEDAQYGIRGVLNNIPGLIMALGGTAGLAGAISIAAVSGSVLFEWLSKTEEKASDVADRISDVAGKMGEIETDRFNTVADGIDAAREAADALESKFDATREAENKMTSSVLENTEKVAAAQRNIAEVLGLQVDAYNEIERAEAAAAAKREQTAQAQIAAEERKREAAEEAVRKAAEDLAIQQKRAEDEKAALVEIGKELDALREKREALEKFSTGKGYLSQLPSTPGLEELQQFSEERVKQPGSFQKLRSDVQAEAGRQLEDPLFKTLLEGTQKRFDALDAKVAALTDENKGAVVNAENALNAADAQLKDVQSAVQINISQIEQSLAADTTLARSQTLVESSKQFAADLTEAVGQIQTSNERGVAAKQSLLAAAADGKITADEAAQVALDTRTLIGLLQGGLATTDSNVKDMIKLVNEFRSSQLANEASIRELRAMISQPR